MFSIPSDAFGGCKFRVDLCNDSNNAQRGHQQQQDLNYFAWERRRGQRHDRI